MRMFNKKNYARYFHVKAFIKNFSSKLIKGLLSFHIVFLMRIRILKAESRYIKKFHISFSSGFWIRLILTLS